MSCIFSWMSCCPCCCTLFLFALALIIYAILKNYGYLPKKSVKGDHIFITGAGSGIGRQMALKFSSKGAKISIADINIQGALKVASEITTQGGQAIAIECNVMSSQSVKQAASKAREAFGDVTILINNAGIVSGKKILEVPESMVEKTIAINTTSHAYTVKEFLPSMLKNNKGHIVTISSAAGTLGVCGLSDYCASKFGAFGFDESLRMELKQLKSNVRTTCLCPFYINTGMFDGVKSKFSWLLPIMSEQWASSRIVNAILQNEEVCLLPWACNLTFVLRAFLPTDLFDKITFFLGANSSMDEFKGRKNVEGLKEEIKKDN